MPFDSILGSIYNKITDTLDVGFEYLGRLFDRHLPTEVTAWLEFYEFTGSAIDDTAQVPLAELTENGAATRIPIQNLTLSFPMYEVPRATFLLAVGYNAADRTLAKIHQVVNGLQKRVRVECWLQLKGRESPFRDWPKAPFRVWRGVVISPAFTRSREATTYSISSAHWITELDDATLLSQDIIKNSPLNFTANYSLATGGSGGEQVPVGAALWQYARNGAARGDAWLDTLLPMLSALGNPGQSSLKGVSILPPFTENNWQATVTTMGSTCKFDKQAYGNVFLNQPQLTNERAFKLINDRFVSQADSVGDKRVTIVPPDLTFPENLNFINYYSQSMADLVANPLAGKTVWEKIEYAASQYRFTPIVNVENAALAPHMPVIHKSRVWRNVYPSEYLFVRVNSSSPVRLAGVGLVGRNKSATSDFWQQDPTVNDGRIVGAFHSGLEGKFAILQADNWLDAQVLDTNIWDENAKPRSVHYASGAADANHAKDANDAAVATQRTAYGCEICRKVWHDETFRNRTAQLVGKLRFDIAPGSQIRVVTNGLNLTGAVAGPSNAGSVNGFDYVHANVAQVDVVIDAMDPKAHTVLFLSHLRAEPEADFANTEHPLYPKKAWYGSPLVRLDGNDMMPAS